jgi:hypothetical protein
LLLRRSQRSGTRSFAPLPGAASIRLDSAYQSTDAAVRTGGPAQQRIGAAAIPYRWAERSATLAHHEAHQAHRHSCEALDVEWVAHSKPNEALRSRYPPQSAPNKTPSTHTHAPS